jgi:hypothetical protein
VAVSASGNPENIKNIALVQSLPDLSPEEVKEIEDVGKTLHFRHYVSNSPRVEFEI